MIPSLLQFCKGVEAQLEETEALAKATRTALAAREEFSSMVGIQVESEFERLIRPGTGLCIPEAFIPARKSTE